MKLRSLFISLLFIAVTGSSFAQVVSPVDFMRYNSRAAFANPAFYCHDYGYFDFALGGINVGFQNIGLKYDKFFRYNSAGYPSALTLDNGVASLRSQNYLNTYAGIDIFNCGRRTKYGFFTYSHRFREWETFRYSRDLLRLVAEGNSSFLGENSAKVDVGLAANAYQEFNFGYQVSLTEKLNIGARVKFLMGFANVKTNDVNLQLFTDADTYALRLIANASAQAALPYQLVLKNGKIKIADRRFNLANLFKNYGAGIDLGAEYMINDQFGVAAAVNDLGFISWTNNTASLTAGIVDAGPYYQNGGLVFEGFTDEQVQAMINDPSYLEHWLDTMMQYVGFDLTTGTKYTAGLNTSMMVRGYYDLTPEHRFTAQFMGFATGLGMKPAMTLAYTGSFAKKFDVVATYTMMPGSYDNIGVGLSANLGSVTIYAASNNVLGFFNPVNISQVNLQFGLSFSANEKVDRSETIIIRDQAREAEYQEPESSVD